MDMPIRPFLEQDHSFGPEDLASVSAAFDAARSKLGLVDPDDPDRVAVIKLIIEVAKEGERDPQRLCDQAIKRLVNFVLCISPQANIVESLGVLSSWADAL